MFIFGKKLLALTLTAATLSTVAPLGALASSSDSWFDDTRQSSTFGERDGRDADANNRSYDPGYYLDAPSYPYVPQGGNSGGENFPHSGT